MLQLCYYSDQGTSTTWIFPVVISLMGLIVAYYSWQANTKPLLIFYMNKKTGRYKIKNVGRGPAMNLLISYVVNENEPHNWINPVRCFCLKSGGFIDMDWVISEQNRALLLKKHKKNPGPDDVGKVFFITDNEEKDKKPMNEVVRKDILTPGHGVFKYGVTYSSAFGIGVNYTTIIEDDVSQIKTGNHLKEWKKDQIVLLWQACKEEDFGPIIK